MVVESIMLWDWYGLIIRYKNNIDGLVAGEYGNLKDGIYMRIYNLVPTLVTKQVSQIVVGLLYIPREILMIDYFQF